MLPEITDTLMARAIATARMIEAGRDYWRRGRVGPLVRTAAGDGVGAAVRGSARAPYEVEVTFGPRSSVETWCSCPVGIGCKHAAAVLFALREDAGGTAAPASLPPALAQWAAAMRPLVERAGARDAARGIVYVVRAQALAGTVRMSRKRPAATLAPAGCAVRLMVEAMAVAFDAAGQPVGSGTRVRPPGAYAPVEAQATMPDDAEDRLLVRRLAPGIGDTDHEACLAGAGGAELLDRVLATGRARWGTVRGPVLHRAPAMAARPGWTHDAKGQVLPCVPACASGWIVALVAPPVAIDPDGGAVAPLDLGIPPAVAEQLLRMPPIEPAAVAAVAARWTGLVGAGVPPPVAPDIRALGAIAPVPVVTLRMEQVAVEHHAGPWRYRTTQRIACAVARLTFDYAGAGVDAATIDAVVLARDADGLFRFTRDRTAEAAALTRLRATGLLPLAAFGDVQPAPGQAWDHATDLPADGHDYAVFLLHDAPRLRDAGWRVEVPADFPLRLVTPDADSLAVEAVSSGIDWFDLALGATIDGVRVDLVPALRRLLAGLGADGIDALAARCAPDALLPVVLDDGRVATVAAAQLLPLLRALLLLATNDAGGAGGGVARLDLGLIAELDDALPGMAWRAAEPLRRLARGLARMQLEPTPLPPGFAATLRPYQQTGLDWLEALAGAGLGGLLADDMGLGKTVQTLAHVAAQKARGRCDAPVLIVAPTSVLPNWQGEIARFVPDLSVLLLHGPGRRAAHDRIAAHDIVLTSYPLLARDRAVLAAERFALVVFDEAQTLRNPRTAGHAAARALVADRRIALSGTPVENRLTDAWALFDLIVPGLLGDRGSFARDYRIPIETHGDTAAAARLSRRLRPFLLRRTKAAVAPDLPPRTVMSVRVEPGAAQMALHESHRVLMQQRVRDEIARVGLMRAQIVILSALTRLRQICCDPRLLPADAGRTPPPGSAKLDRLLELLDGMVAEGRRIILFSQFTSMLDLVKPELDRHGHGWVEITGRTKDRRDPVARFQAGAVPLILISLKAGGTGLNLTAADTVILYDPWWNPAVEAQAIDRAHRIGQDRPVFVYRLIAAGTVEEKILALQDRKAALAEALWSDDPATPSALTEDDIAFLLE